MLIQAAVAQDGLRGSFIMGMGDVTAIKQKAEAGDAAAQVALGDVLASRFHASEGLEWYRKAAAQGNVAKIEKDSVQIAVEGEDAPRLLRLK